VVFRFWHVSGFNVWVNTLKAQGFVPRRHFRNSTGCISDVFRQPLTPEQGSIPDSLFSVKNGLQSNTGAARSWASPKQAAGKDTGRQAKRSSPAAPYGTRACPEKGSEK